MKNENIELYNTEHLERVFVFFPEERKQDIDMNSTLSKYDAIVAFYKECVKEYGHRNIVIVTDLIEPGMLCDGIVNVEIINFESESTYKVKQKMYEYSKQSKKLKSSEEDILYKITISALFLGLICFFIGTFL